jgi:indole-3-glycerol phosphate synthase
MILDEILAEKRRTVGYSRFRLPLADLESKAIATPAALDFVQALRSTGDVACIAEFKRRSPSKGWIHRDADLAAVASAYQRGGASAMSVLTDTPFFGGTLDDLRLARGATGLPLLRKDFIIDPYQVVEARAAGADAVLLIVAALQEGDLRALVAEARRWGMDALVEAHDPDEVARAVALGASLIGVNHRDLRTFQMNMDLAVRMRALVPPHCLMVAESGIRDAADVDRMRRAGIGAILVGETLMQASDPALALRALLAKP